MGLSFLPAFIADLQDHADANFARRVLNKVVARDGRFRVDIDDHRYDGIPDAWIRYVSRGNSAYRVIYVRKGEDVFLYRCGEHSIEERLSAPADSVFDAAMMVDGMVGAPAPDKWIPRQDRPKRVLCSVRTPTLYQMIMDRRLVPHREVVLVSPFLSLSLLKRYSTFGKLLNAQLEDGAKVTLLTRPPSEEYFDEFADIEARGIDLLFHPRLHAKFYMFTTAPDRQSKYAKPVDDLLALGSANLTENGLAGGRELGNEELSYLLPSEDREEIENFLALLVNDSFDLRQTKNQWARRRR